MSKDLTPEEWRKIADAKLAKLRVIDTRFENTFNEFTRFLRVADPKVQEYAEQALWLLTTGEEAFRGDNLTREIWGMVDIYEGHLEPEQRSNRRHIARLCDIMRTMSPEMARRIQSRLNRQALGLADPTEDRFTFKTVADLINAPPLQWMIAGIIPEKALAVVYGPPRSFKSFIVQDMALSVATGRNWMNRQTVDGSVLYVAAEGEAGLGKRIKAWMDYYDFHAEDFPFYSYGAAINLAEPSEVDKLIRSAPEGLKMIVFDTLNRCMVGLDENSAKDVSAFIKGCARLQEELDVTVVLVHHTGKDQAKGVRGSTAITGAADTLIKVNRDDNHVTVECEKQKDFEEFEPFALQAEEAGDSLVFIPAPYQAVATPSKAKTPPPALAAILRVLDQNKNGLTPKEIMDLAKISESSWKRHKKELLEKGRIRQEGNRYFYVSALGLDGNKGNASGGEDLEDGEPVNKGTYGCTVCGKRLDSHKQPAREYWHPDFKSLVARPCPECAKTFKPDPSWIVGKMTNE